MADGSQTKHNTYRVADPDGNLVDPSTATLKLGGEDISGSNPFPVTSIIISPVAENLVTGASIGSVDDTFIDIGDEIDCRGYKSIGVYVNFTVNNSTTNTLQVLSKHTADNANEYILETSADYQKVLGDTNKKVLYVFNADGINYIQLQTKAAVLGATPATISIDIVKEY